MRALRSRRRFAASSPAALAAIATTGTTATVAAIATIARRAMGALLVATMVGGCDMLGSGTDDKSISFVCLTEGPPNVGGDVVVNVGGQEFAAYTWALDHTNCDETDATSMQVSVTVDHPAIATVTPATKALSFVAHLNNNSPSGSVVGADAVGTFTIAGVAPGVTRARYRMTWPNGSPAGEVVQTITVRATMGTINVVISGLPAGVDADVTVGSALLTQTSFVRSGTMQAAEGAYPWFADPVTVPGGQMYVPSPTTGLVDVIAGQTSNIAVVYTASTPTTGALNVQVGGNLPGGTNADVVVTGPNGFSQVVTGSQVLTGLAPGTYTVTTRDVITPNRDHGATGAASQQLVVTAGATTMAPVTYATLRRLVRTSFTGTVAPGTATTVTYTQNGTPRTATTTNTDVKLPLGTNTVTSTPQTVSGRTYQLTPTAAAVINVLDGSTPQLFELAFWLAVETFGFNAAFAIFSDPFSHAPFIVMWTNAVMNWVITYVFLTSEPADMSQVAGIASITVTGPGPFVTATGTLNADRTFSLTGTGTVAGFANVPVALTGSLSAARVLTGAQYRMGQVAAPTGLPNGPIIYTLTGTAASLIVR